MALTATPRPSPPGPGAAAAPATNPEVRRLARGGSLNLAGLVVYGLANFAVVVVITRSLGPAGAGVALSAIAAFSILVRTCALGADLGMVRAVSRALASGRPADGRALRSIALVPVAAAALGAGALLAALARPFAEHLGSAASAPQLASVLRVLALVLPFAATYAVLESASRGYGTMGPSALIEKVAKPTLQLALVALGAAFGVGVVGLMALWTVPVVGAWLAMRTAVTRLQRRAAASDPRPAAGPAPASPGPTDGDAANHRGLRREFWSFARPRALAGTFQVGVLWSDTLLIGVLAGTAAAGVYASSTRFLLLGSFVQLAIGQAIQPRLADRFARGDLDAVRALYQAGTAWSVVVTWPVFLAIAIWAPVLLGVFGAGYGGAATVLAVLGLAWLVATACGPVDSVLLMAGRSGLTTVNLGIALVIDVGLNLVLIPAHGITGAALAWAVAIVFLNVTPLLQVWRTHRVHPFGPALRRAVPLALACFALPGLALRATIGPHPAVMALALAAGGGAYLLGAYALRRTLGLDAFAAGTGADAPGRRGA